MNGYQAILKRQDDDRSAKAREGPMESIWYLDSKAAEEAGQRINERHHHGACKVVINMKKVDRYIVTWHRTSDGRSCEDIVYAPMGQGQQMAMRFLEERVGKGRFIINAVNYRIAK